MPRYRWTPTLILAVLLAASCGSDTAETVTSESPASTTASSTTVASDPSTVEGEHFGPACEYTNPFTGDTECRRYVGDGWDDTTRAADCSAPFSTVEGMLGSGGCEPARSVGTCRIGAGGPEETLTFYYGGDTSLLAQFCANPGGGVWVDQGEDAAAAPTPPDEELQPEVAEALIDTAEVVVAPECTDGSCIASLVEERGALEFSPRSSTPRTGLVLFPGASVDVRAYAPLAQIIARSGVLVAVVPVPGGISLGNEDRVDTVTAAHPEIDTWFVGGHSLGGVAAATYVANDGTKTVVSGLVLWAAYTNEELDLSDSEIAATSIYGTEDGLTTVDEVESGRSSLPADTLYVEIEGGNHAQFGFYGVQEGDGEALISQDVQANLVAEATAYFMAGITAGSIPALDVRYAIAAELEDSWCARSQEITANLSDQTPTVTIEEIRGEQDFVRSKASVDETGLVRIPMYRFRIGQHTSLDAPPILTGELWCKHKSQDHFVAQGATASGEPGSCAAVNGAAWDWALAQLTDDESDSVASAGLDVVFAPDIVHDTGPAWLSGEVGITTDGTTVTITSSRLFVAADADLEDPQNTGLTYCKLWTPSEALRLALNP